MVKIFSRYPRWQEYAAVALIAFCIRAALFWGYIQHEERYCQPDSVDYHISALCIAHGYGMFRPDNKQPIFWRTPGYPLFLAPFYRYNKLPITAPFEEHRATHCAALWLQITLCSFLPILIFWLAITITSLLPVAWLVMCISVIHVGFVVASTFLLTDALGLLFFTLFLISFFYAYTNNTKSLAWLCAAAGWLAVYTWLRPMGQFVACAVSLLLFTTQDTWSKKLQKITIFITLFFILLMPWFVRNYHLTGKVFFCPLIGLYLNVFNAPKIIARTTNISLKNAHTALTQAAAQAQRQELYVLQRNNSPYYMCGELVCLSTAWPIIREHPFLCIYDWIIEVCKTTFDLYSYQLVALVNNHFKWDPLVEYLPEKWAACLWASYLPLPLRMIAWLEALWVLLTWLGIAWGVYLFLLKPLWSDSTYWVSIQKYCYMWLVSGIIIGSVVMQSGGFGYARLRLPVEPLIIIISVTFWWFIFIQQVQRKKA
ncbi:MAG: hypothetical protein WC707_05015 [Candidatus Babeliaceae bacterium]|jgi:hypothetical protein